jgi:hypothetical protein
MLYRDNTEPAVEELLADPIAHLLMSRDGLEVEAVWAQIEDARMKLRRRKRPQKASVAPTGRRGNA